MSVTTKLYRFVHRRNTAAGAAANNDVLYDGEIGLESDTDKFKFGNAGVHYNDRPYANVTPAEHAASMAAERALQSATYAAKDKRPFTEFATQRGLAPALVDRGRKFLAFRADGAMYAANMNGGNRTIEISTDAGATWTTRGTPNTSVGIQHLTVTTAGSLIAWCVGGTPPGTLHRSADGGVNWTQVATAADVLHHGITQASNGTLYLAEYAYLAGQYTGGVARVLSSTDDGATWTTLDTFPSTLDGGTGTKAVRHLHGIAALPSGVWAFTGDSDTENGFFKLIDGAFVRQSPMISGEPSQTYRAVSLFERGGFLYWGVDSSGFRPSYLYKAPVGDLADVTKLADSVASIYYGAVVGDDILLGTVNENTIGTAAYEDEFVRLYRIGLADEVEEVFKGRVRADNPIAGKRPGLLNIKAHPSDGKTVLFNTSHLDSTDTTYTVHGVRAALLDGADVMTLGALPAPSNPGRYWQVVGTVSEATTTSTAFTTVPQLEVEVQSNGLPFLVTATCTLRHSAAGANVYFGLSSEGVNPSGVDGHLVTLAVAGGQQIVTISKVFVPPPGIRTFSAKWRVQSGTATATSVLRHLTVVELGR